uniref:HCLS1 associated protein X-1 n=1 Tax=Leptobrachium leishanense TaxID=445787 RepID=A0A8C5QA16_9ANUR
MSVFDLFRRFFEPGGRRDPFFGGMTWEDEDDDDDNDKTEDSGYPFGHPPSYDFGFSFGPREHPFSDPFAGFFRDFNELFAGLGSIDMQMPGLQDMDPPPPQKSEARTLRDFMLKYPDSRLPKDQVPDSTTPAFPKMPRTPGRIPWQEDDTVRIPHADSRQDRDLDSEVSSQGLDAILTPSGPRSSSYFKSVSVSRVTKPDGTTEERRTVTDSQGNTTTTVTVLQGDQILGSTSENLSGGTFSGDQLDGTRDRLRGTLDMSDSQTILLRILQKWFQK